MAAAGTQCGKLVCGTGADACTSSLTCHCIGGFYGPTCSGIFYVDQSSSFWAYFSLELILFVVLTGCGVALAAFYFGTYLRRIGDRDPRNPQLIGLLFLTTASLLRMLHACISMGAGTNQVVLYMMSPSGMGGVLRFTYGFYFPCVLAALTIQELLWIQISAAVRAMRPMRAGAKTWLPRLKWIFYPVLAFVFIMEFVTQMLLTFLVNSNAVVLAYRVVLLLDIVALLIIAFYFGSRVLKAMNQQQSLTVSKQDGRIARSRRNLTRLIFITCVLLACGVALTTMTLIPAVSATPGGYWFSQFTQLILEAAVVCSLMYTFYEMMNSRLKSIELQQQGKPGASIDTVSLGRSEDQSEREEFEDEDDVDFDGAAAAPSAEVDGYKLIEDEDR